MTCLRSEPMRNDSRRSWILPTLSRTILDAWTSRLIWRHRSQQGSWWLLWRMSSLSRTTTLVARSFLSRWPPRLSRERTSVNEEAFTGFYGVYVSVSQVTTWKGSGCFWLGRLEQFTDETTSWYVIIDVNLSHVCDGRGSFPRYMRQWTRPFYNELKLKLNL